jgi:hypothetical protein
LPAVAGLALLAAGGGFVFWRMGPKPAAPVPAPHVAQPTPSEPAPTPPTPKPADSVAEAHPSEQAQTPPANPPPTSTPPVEDNKPPQVAKVEPSPTPKTSKPPRISHPSKPAPAAPVGKGTVVFRVRPYATVILSGKNLGQTPFDPVETSAGKYTVQFINDDLKKKVTQAFELKPGETKVIKINLEE